MALEKVTIFDIDNTLINSKEKLERDVLETFERLGKKVNRNRIRGNWYSLAKKYNIPRAVFDHEFSKRDSWEDSIKKGYVTLFDEAIPTLESLKSEKYKIFLLSRSSKEYTEQKIDMFNLSKYVDDMETVDPYYGVKDVGAVRLIGRNNPEKIKHVYAVGDKIEDVNIIYPIKECFQIDGTGIYLRKNLIQKIQSEIKKVNSLKEALKIIHGN